MRPTVFAVLALMLLPAAALAQSRAERLVARYHLELQQCLGRNAGRASAQPEATRDTVADYAAKQCEVAYIKKVTRRKLMEPAQARIEVDMMAYQLAERILSH